MSDLPVLLKLAGRRCVIVGGGSVALRRGASLVACGAQVVIIAPQASDELRAVGATLHERPYRGGDLAGAFLVVIATDDPRVNQSVAEEAAERGVLVNRADDPDAGDLTVPAHGQYGPITLAVHSGGVSAQAAARIRDELASKIDPDWVTLLELARPYRAAIQQRFTDPSVRRERLMQLTGPDAISILKKDGAGALQRYLDALASSSPPCTTPSPR